MSEKNSFKFGIKVNKMFKGTWSYSKAAAGREARRREHGANSQGKERRADRRRRMKIIEEIKRRRDNKRRQEACKLAMRFKSQ